MLSGTIRTIVKTSQRGMNWNKWLTRFFFLSVQPPQTLQILSCWTWSACLSAQAQAVICAVVASSAQLGAARTQEELGLVAPEYGSCLLRLNQGISPDSRTLFQLVHFETHHIPSLFSHIVTSQKVKPILVCTFEVPFLLTFFFQLLLWSAFRKEYTQQHWQAVLSTGLLPSYLMSFSYFFLLHHCLRAVGVFMVTAIP